MTTLPKRPHYNNGEFYDPQNEYYHLTYNVISSIKWIRSPFLTLKEVKDSWRNSRFCLPLVFHHRARATCLASFLITIIFRSIMKPG